MILLPSAGGTRKVPPLIEVPVGAVTSTGTWQVAQPVATKVAKPAMLSAGEIGPRAGTFVARMKSANCRTSFSLSSGSATASQDATERPSAVFSTGNKALVTPISFRYASAENDSRL